MNKKSALVISFSDLKRDPRVHRQLTFLLDLGFEVTAVGFKSPEIEGVHFISAQIPNCGILRLLFNRMKKLIKLIFKRYDSIYWNNLVIQHVYRQLDDTQFDLYIGNDIDSLPLVLKLAKGGNVLFDAHEYSPWSKTNDRHRRALQATLEGCLSVFLLAVRESP